MYFVVSDLKTLKVQSEAAARMGYTGLHGPIKTDDVGVPGAPHELR